MNIAIIDPIGSHGSSHHFYLFGQAEGLINNGVNVSLFTNSKTSNPKINGLKFYQSFGNIFMTNNKLLNGVKFVLGVSTLYLKLEFQLIILYIFMFFILIF